MPRIVITSDLHGTLPTALPAGEVLLLAGDLCPGGKSVHQHQWLDSEFRAWLATMSARFEAIIGIAGNHDWAFESGFYPRDLPWTYLCDEGTMWRGLTVWGSPHQPPFHDWAFNLSEERIAAHLARAPESIDILITHGPPYLTGDRTMEGTHAGSLAVRRFIEERTPLLHCCGHIHEGYGVSRLDATWCVNASLMTRSYRPTQGPVVVDIDPATRRLEVVAIG